MTQKMLTVENRKALPPLYTNANLVDSDDAVAVVKFFNPTGAETWYITEFDGDDLMFGYVTGNHVDEWGYVSLAELSAVTLRFGLKIERDIWFKPTTIAKIKGGRN